MQRSLVLFITLGAVWGCVGDSTALDLSDPSTGGQAATLGQGDTTGAGGAGGTLVVAGRGGEGGAIGGYIPAEIGGAGGGNEFGGHGGIPGLVAGGGGSGVGGAWSENWTTVAFRNGRAMSYGDPTGIPNGYAWVAVAPETSLISPLCGGAPITAVAPCSEMPDWSEPQELCISGSVPAIDEGLHDEIPNGGFMVGVNTTEPAGGGLGAAYSRTFVTFSGAPATGVRLVVHRRNDPESITYCVAVTTLARIPFSAFNTRCWDGTGITLEPEDVANIDKIALHVPPSGSRLWMDNLCWSGLYLQ